MSWIRSEIHLHEQAINLTTQHVGELGQFPVKGFSEDSYLSLIPSQPVKLYPEREELQHGSKKYSENFGRSLLCLPCNGFITLAGATT